MTQIFKLQRSLETNDPRGQLCLIYNKDRSVWLEGPYTHDMDGLFGNKDKIYVEGEIIIDHVGKRRVGVIKVVDDQPW